jgi:hypoxanthine phosphoribosyltransferase
MDQVTIKDKTFIVSIPSTTIQSRIDQMAAEFNVAFKDKNPVFLCVLNGAFLFASEVFKRMNIECEIAFVRVKSYSGTGSTGVVKSVFGISENMSGRTVVIIEDIVDTGHTAVYLLNELNNLHPREVKFATLLFKPAALQHPMKPDYVGFEVPNDFLVGFGLDYDGLGRNLNDIYKLKSTS